MSIRHFLAGLFAGSVFFALAATAGPARAGCDCNIVASCSWFTLEWQDACPNASTGDMGKTLDDMNERRMYERLAHGVAYAARCWRDKTLRVAQAGAPIALVRPSGGPVAQDVGSNQPDSVVARFRKADGSTVEQLYTIRLGTYESRDAARANFDHWGFLHPKVDAPITEPALQDSLLAISWGESTCAGAWIANLFVLPPSLSASGSYDLDFRLLIDPRDAARVAKLLELRLMTHTEIVPVKVTGDVLFYALGL